MNNNIQVKNNGQGKLFANPVIEVLTKTNPFIHIITYGGVIFFLFYYFAIHENKSGISMFTQLFVFAGGILFWTFFEYMMHRYLFHMGSNSKLLKRIQYALHGVHHEYPRDEERVFMPPLPGIIIISALLAFFYFIFVHYAFLFLAAMILGYLIYSLMHYNMHHVKPHRLFKSLWAHHALHHYKYPDKAFGVSTTVWDYIFGTMPPKRIRAFVNKKNPETDVMEYWLPDYS